MMSAPDSIHLKAALLTDGIAAGPEALVGVGAAFKEQNHGLFGWDLVDHADLALPDDFLLSDGTVVQFRYNPASPYELRFEEGRLVVGRAQEILDTASMIPRPTFYDALTEGGVVMRKIAQVGGEDCFFVCYHNHCSHFARQQECAFCNLVPTEKTYHSVLPKKEIEVIAEVAAAAFSEGRCRHVLLTGGCFSPEKEVALVVRIVEALRKALGGDSVPGTILPSATIAADDLCRYRETGIGAIAYSMEIWDEALFRAICPGKSRSTPHEEFVSAIKRAVGIFGAGNVYGVLVMGLEPKKSFLEGVRSLSALGANVVPFVWSPNPGSALEGHRAPTAGWFADTILEAADIVGEAGLPSGDENHCYRCDGNSLLHDALRIA
jgi:hypothetical protein